MRPYKIFSLIFLCLSLLPCEMQAQRRVSNAEQQSAIQDSSRSQGRLRPPTGLSCDRNHTTSFTGRIIAYSRTARRIFIQVRTDEQTTEQFTISLRRGEDASKKFLFQGEAFQPDDWKQIEKGRGLLKPKMRATIWACRDQNDDFQAELIDWRPNENGGSFVL